MPPELQHIITYTSNIICPGYQGTIFLSSIAVFFIAGAIFSFKSFGFLSGCLASVLCMVLSIMFGGLTTLLVGSIYVISFGDTYAWGDGAQALSKNLMQCTQKFCSFEKYDIHSLSEKDKEFPVTHDAIDEYKSNRHAFSALAAKPGASFEIIGATQKGESYKYQDSVYSGYFFIKLNTGEVWMVPSISLGFMLTTHKPIDGLDSTETTEILNAQKSFEKIQ